MIRSIPDPQKTTEKQAESCRLCGLPVRGRTDGFCCTGCRHVFDILQSMLDTEDAGIMRGHDYFTRMREMGIIPPEEGGPAPGDGDARPSVGDAGEEGESESFMIKVRGMWCPSCSWVIERVLLQHPGVTAATASFSTDRVRVIYLPRRTGPAQIARAIEGLGYQVEDGTDGGEEERELRRELMRLGISVFLTANVMMLSFGIYQGFFTDLSLASLKLLTVPIFLMATAVLSYGGFPIFERALQAARAGGFVMESLIAMGALAAYGIGVLGLIRGSPHVYFDTACMLVTLILLGKYLERRMRVQATRGVEEIYGLMPGKARLLTEGGERYVSVEAVAPGDTVRVTEKEVIPVDGTVLSGTGAADESKLTGEFLLRSKGPGESVLAASLLESGELMLRVSGVGPESSIGRMISLMEEAILNKNPFERFTDRVVSVFAPVVILAALAVGGTLLLRGSPVETALVRMITILVIACPCALGIATPLARVAAIGRARRDGILVVNGDALEAACRTDVLVLDKTGTATYGAFEVTGVEAFGGSREEVLAWAVSVECASEHPVARAIRKAAAGPDLLGTKTPVGTGIPESDILEIPGMGVRGAVDGETVLVGNEEMMRTGNVRIPRDDRGQDTNVYVARGGCLAGIIRLSDTVRPDMPDAVAALRKMGVRVELVSGDTEPVTERVAGVLGVDRFAGGVLPAGKVARVRDLQAAGFRVGMVGDGANDAAALAAADVGFATGDALTVTRNASDITILSFSGTRLLSALEISRLTSRTVRINLALAFVYNLVALPAAAAGLVNPIVAIIAMMLSSLTVVGNSARTARK